MGVACLVAAGTLARRCHRCFSTGGFHSGASR
jgi:hypothetical protein